MGTIVLDDGRSLAYADLGDRAGAPILYFHGAFGTPLAPTPELADRLAGGGVRIVCPLRPGFGGSDPSPGRSIMDWPRDVAALADRLGLGRFSVLGVSTGAPYAAACGAALPDRLAAVGMVSTFVRIGDRRRLTGVGTQTRVAMMLARRTPRFTRAGLALTAWVVRRRPGLLLGVMSRANPTPPDAGHLAAGGASSAVAAFRQATDGSLAAMVEDAALVSRPWGFSPRHVPVEVRLWHGALDRTVPVHLARRLAAELPACRAEVDPHAGHFFFRSRMREILGALAAAG